MVLVFVTHHTLRTISHAKDVLLRDWHLWSVILTVFVVHDIFIYLFALHISGVIILVFGLGPVVTALLTSRLLRFCFFKRVFSSSEFRCSAPLDTNIPGLVLFSGNN